MTETLRQERARLWAQLQAQGGRGVELADRIDEIDAELARQDARRERMNALLKSQGCARYCEIPDELPRYALKEDDCGSADNGGPWWNLHDSWQQLTTEAANQEHPEDWPASLLVDLDTGEEWECEMHYTVHVVGKFEDDENLALWFTPGAIRDHFEDDDDERGAFVRAASDEVLAGIGQDCLSHDAIYNAFHNVLAYEVEEALEAAKSPPK